MVSCSISGCGRPVKSRGWCTAHYERWRRTGDPETPHRSPGRPQSGEANANWRGGKHGHPLYGVYHAMIGRCTRPTDKRYADYGGRGITVCDRWRDDFWAFVADMGDRPEGHSLDRIDNDRGYSPDNCRWATAHEQRVNRRPTSTTHQEH